MKNVIKNKSHESLRKPFSGSSNSLHSDNVSVGSSAIQYMFENNDSDIKQILELVKDLNRGAWQGVHNRRNYEFT